MYGEIIGLQKVADYYISNKKLDFKPHQYQNSGILTDEGCVQEYPKRFIRTYGSHTRQYSLSSEELLSYLNVMKIKSICFPEIFGQPFLNVDWNSQTKTADSGRKISIGLDNLKDYGSGWGGYMEYTTYDFGVGAEYDTFAQESDSTAVVDGTKENIITVNGKKGFVLATRFVYLDGTKGDFEKVVVFPFRDYYVAFIYPLKNSSSEPDELKSSLYDKNTYPWQYEEGLRDFDTFISSVSFE